MDERPHGHTVALQRVPTHEPTPDGIPVRNVQRLHRTARGRGPSVRAVGEQSLATHVVATERRAAEQRVALWPFAEDGRHRKVQRLRARVRQFVSLMRRFVAHCPILNS
jgi:hypothetical protein